MDAPHRAYGAVALLAAAPLLITATAVVGYRWWRDRPANVLRRIAAAEAAWQSGAYDEFNCWGVGTYGHLDQLCGREQSYTKHVRVRMLDLDLSAEPGSAATPARHAFIARQRIAGYRYASILAVDAAFLIRTNVDAQPTDVDAGMAASRRFVVVAWPDGHDVGGTCWIVTATTEPRPVRVAHAESPEAIVVAAFGSMEPVLPTTR